MFFFSNGTGHQGEFGLALFLTGAQAYIGLMVKELFHTLPLLGYLFGKLEGTN